jgi:hypothetical protein
MLAAAEALLDSVDSAAALVAVVLQEPAVRAPRVLVPLLVVPALVVAQALPEPLLLHLLSSPLPQVVVESEVPLHPQGRPSSSAAMARSSPPTVQPTCERAPSTR